MKKSRLSLAVSCGLVTGTLALTLSSRLVSGDDKCTGEDCETPAPYTLKIITHGEGSPRAANDSDGGLQENRRVDVSLSRRVPVKDAVPVAGKESAPKPGKASALPANPQAGSGTYWVSQNPNEVQPFLGIKVPSSATVIDGALENPLKISLATNYSAFLDRWELRISRNGSALNGNPLFSRHGKLDGAITDLEWDGKLPAASLPDGLRPGEEYYFSVRVYDRQGNFDETVASRVKLVSEELGRRVDTAFQSVDGLSVKELSEEQEQFSRGYARQGISVAGSTVTVRGQDINDVQSVEVNGENIPLGSNEDFSAEYILPPGEHEFDIKAKRTTGRETEEKLGVKVKANHFFMVGLADLTIGNNNISGSVEPLAADEDRFGGDLFVDGRLAFYLKGKVRGKYLLTAQLDTGTEDVSELFDEFRRDDPNSIFRRIDPDEFYLVYGDDSTISNDTDSQGKVYVRVDWDKSYALWGNFNTAFSGTEFAPFNRSLHGAQFVNRSVTTTALGDNVTEISAFVSEAQTIFRHNEFRGTGGSLYFLRDQDIVLGSEKVWVEVRRNNSEQVVQRLPLQRGRDYEIDEFQGRIILTRPLLSISTQTGPSIIRDEVRFDDNTFLVVDYEFIPTDFDPDDATGGVRARRWVNDHVAIGGTYAAESRDTDDYSVAGVDLTLKKSDATFLRFELAQSEASQTSGSFISDDGGLSFSPFNSNSTAASVSGNAIGIEGRVAANEYAGIDRPVTIAAWAKRRDAGFSTASLDTGADTTDTGIEAVAEINEKLSLSARATRLEREAETRESVVAVQVDYLFTDIITVGGELRRINDEALSGGTSEASTLGAGKVTVDFSEYVTAYGIAQGTLDRSGNSADNNLLTLGAKAKISDAWSLNGEVSTGNRGFNLTFGAEHIVNDTYSVYGNVNLFNDTDDVLGQSITVGQRKTLTSSLAVFSEHQFSTEESRVAKTNTIGLNNTFNRYTTGNLSFQSSRIDDDLGDVVERDTVTAGLSYKRDEGFLSSRLEFRRDESNTVDTNQWVLTNNAEYRSSDSMRWQGRLNFSSTEDNITGVDEAKFVEAGIGFAYRPVFNDRFNMLGRYTYLFDLPPLSQSDRTDNRLSIFSLENVYELGKRYSIGGKLAYREGEIRTTRVDGLWISNDATLASLRLRYRTPFGIHGLASYSWLGSDATEGLRQGALLSVGRTVGQNLQFSVGYNFSSFDDDLGNDDFDVQGWFLNLIGKY